MRSVSRTGIAFGTAARIADVAARAGVGVATVSRVLNGRANVHPETRARVLEAIDALEYRPSPIARNLSLRRTHVIGVVVPSSPALAVERVRGIVTVLARSPYDLVLFDIEAEERQEHAFRLFAGRSHRRPLAVSLIPPDDEVDGCAPRPPVRAHRRAHPAFPAS